MKAAKNQGRQKKRREVESSGIRYEDEMKVKIVEITRYT